MVVSIQVVLWQCVHSAGYWQEAPIGNFWPLSVLATPVDSWEMLSWSFLRPHEVAASLAKRFKMKSGSVHCSNAAKKDYFN